MRGWKLILLFGLGVQTSSHAGWPEGVIRQQREWRETEAHFNRLAQSNAPSTYKSPLGGSGGNSWFDYEASQRANDQYQNNQQIAANAAKRRSDEIEESNRRARADLQAKFDAIDRAQAENKARAERREWLTNWIKTDVAKAGGLLPIEPAPKFKNDIERFKWHRDLALWGNDAINFDPYSSLICAKMAANGDGTNIDFQKVYDFALKAEDRWSLRRALMAHALIEGIEKPAVDRKVAFDLSMEVLKEIIVADEKKPDTSGGKDYAYEILGRVYFYPQYAHHNAPPDVIWRLNTIAYSGTNDFLQEKLQKILQDNLADLPTILPQTNLHKLVDAVELKSTSPEVLLQLGRASMKDFGDDFAYFFEPVLKRPNSVSLADDEMCLRLLHFALNANSKRARELAEQITPRVWERARNWVSWAQEAVNRDKIQPDAIRILCDWSSGAMGEPSDPNHAQQWAVALMLQGDGTGCVRVGNALRAGRGGWPQSDKKAETLFDIGKAWLPEDKKYGMVFAMAEVFAAQPQWNLPANRAMQLKYLEEAQKIKPIGYGTLRLAQLLSTNPIYNARIAQMLEPYIVDTEDNIRIATKFNLPDIAKVLTANRDEAIALRDKAQR